MKLVPIMRAATPRRTGLAGAAAALLWACAAPGVAQAETLADAIASAYQTNPTLVGQRAQLRITDEAYVQARTGLRPTVTGAINAQRQDFAGQTVNSGSALATITQPLYTGGRTSAAVGAAEADILSGRETLRQTEAGVLQTVVLAYADTLRDQESLGIEQQNLQALEDQLREAEARAKVGDLTRTDVAQSQSYVAQARTSLAQARAQLEISKASYVAAVGHEPAQLEPLPALPNMPSSLDQAVATAEAANPNLRSALYEEQAEKFRTAQARAQRLPNLSLQVQAGGSGPVTALAPNIYARDVTGLATVTVPIFTGGLISSQIRQQIARESTAHQQTESNRRTLAQQLRQNWHTYVAAREDIGNAQAQVQYSQVAFEGVQKERAADLRSTLEVLSIEQNLFQGQLAVASAKHDAYVSAANVLEVMGLLEAKILVPGINPYDPAKAFDKVRNQGAVPWEAAPAALDHIGVSHVHRLPPPPASVTDGQ